MSGAAQAGKLYNEEFANDVLAGLSAGKKHLSSKYFYDEKGDELFRDIMKLDEYYLSRSELEILQIHGEALHSIISETGTTPFQLIELGAGDGSKTKVLLKEFLSKGDQFKYIPIDISANALGKLLDDLRVELPSLNAEGIAGDYFKVLHRLNGHSRKVVLFMGANIGNYSYVEACRFLSSAARALNPSDLMVIGFDLKKDPARILAAYNDKKGVTKAFNLNLLERINRELGGDFDLGKFIHYPMYDPVTGEARSYLVSTCEQRVTIRSHNRSFHFSPWEQVFMEVSKKYTLQEIEQLAGESGFHVKHNFFDTNKNLVDSVWMRQ